MQERLFGASGVVAWGLYSEVSILSLRALNPQGAGKNRKSRFIFTVITVAKE